MGATPLTVFIPILWKLHSCFGHDLKICMWFGYNTQVIFCHFFRKLNLAIFPALYIAKRMDRGYLVGATPTTGLYLFFGNFTGVFYYSCVVSAKLSCLFIAALCHLLRKG